MKWKTRRNRTRERNCKLKIYKTKFFVHSFVSKSEEKNKKKKFSIDMKAKANRQKVFHRSRVGALIVFKLHFSSNWIDLNEENEIRAEPVVCRNLADPIYWLRNFAFQTKSNKTRVFSFELNKACSFGWRIRHHFSWHLFCVLVYFQEITFWHKKQLREFTVSGCLPFPFFKNESESRWFPAKQSSSRNAAKFP